MTCDWRAVLEIYYQPTSLEEIRASYLELLGTLPRPIDVPTILELHEALCAAEQDLEAGPAKTSIFH